MLRTVGQHNGQDVIEATLASGRHCVHILNYGCVVRRWQFDLGQEQRDLVLGFDSFAPYPEHSRSFGIVAGRVANRTSEGRFAWHGNDYQLSVNHGRHHLHGGSVGLGQRIWNAEADSANQSVRLEYLSVDGEEGYPGKVQFSVTYRLDEQGLHCTMSGQPDRPTPVNLAQHNYYNLDVAKDVRQQTLKIDAEQYLPVDDELIPTGEALSVADTRFDFRQAAAIGTVDPLCAGHDHNMILRPQRNQAAPAAVLSSSDKRVRLSIVTDQPGIQLYTSAKLEVPVKGVHGRCYGHFDGICLEAQGFPDSLNQAGFPSIEATPERPYQQRLSMQVDLPDQA